MSKCSGWTGINVSLLPQGMASGCTEAVLSVSWDSCLSSRHARMNYWSQDTWQPNPGISHTLFFPTSLFCLQQMLFWVTQGFMGIYCTEGRWKRVLRVTVCAMIRELICWTGEPIGTSSWAMQFWLQTREQVNFLNMFCSTYPNYH